MDQDLMLEYVDRCVNAFYTAWETVRDFIESCFSALAEIMSSFWEYLRTLYRRIRREQLIYEILHCKGWRFRLYLAKCLFRLLLRRDDTC